METTVTNQKYYLNLSEDAQNNELLGDRINASYKMALQSLDIIPASVNEVCNNKKNNVENESEK